MTDTTSQREVTLASGTTVTVDDQGRHRTYLLLHGGGGVPTMTGFASLLTSTAGARVVLPTHPGFGGTARPAALATTRDLAAAYVELLDQLELTDVTVIGNSFGGWIAAELGLLNSPRLRQLVIVDGIGIDVPGHPMTSVAGLTPAELQQLSFYDPTRAPRPPAGAPAGPSPEIQALIGYAGPTMSDPGLLERLAVLTLPVHVVWGAGDGIVGPEYGRAYAAAIPGASFTLLPTSGHLPQVETPEELLATIGELEAGYR